MTAGQLAAATGEDKGAMINFSFDQSQQDQDMDEERRSVFIDKFEDIGFLDPASSGAGAGKEAKPKAGGKSPSKKAGKDANKKPSLKKI